MSPKEFAKRIGNTVKTLRRWDNSGKLIAHRTPTNRRFFYTEQQYSDIMGVKSKTTELTLFMLLVVVIMALVTIVKV